MGMFSLLHHSKIAVLDLHAASFGFGVPPILRILIIIPPINEFFRCFIWGMQYIPWFSRGTTRLNWHRWVLAAPASLGMTLWWPNFVQRCPRYPLQKVAWQMKEVDVGWNMVTLP